MKWKQKFLAAALLVLGASFASATECSIVYGDDWAFLSTAPKQWRSACGNQAMQGTVVTLWPSSQRSNAANALIYTTVNDKNFPTLQAFAEDEQIRFKKSSPTARISSINTPAKSEKPNYIVARLSGASGSREELVAYFDGPTAYYIVVLTAESGAILDRYKNDFFEYISSFSVMEKREEKKEPINSLKPDIHQP